MHALHQIRTNIFLKFGKYATIEWHCYNHQTEFYVRFNGIQKYIVSSYRIITRMDVIYPLISYTNSIAWIINHIHSYMFYIKGMKVHGVHNWHDAYMTKLSVMSLQPQILSHTSNILLSVQVLSYGRTKKCPLRGVVVKLLNAAFVLDNKNWSSCEYKYGF